MESGLEPWRGWQPSTPVVAIFLTVAVLARSLLSVWTIQRGFVEYNADGFSRIIRGWEWLQAPRWEVDVWLPLHFWFYGAILGVWDHIYLAPRIANFGLGILAIVVLYGIGARLLDRRAGLVAAGIAALFPWEVWLSLSGMSEPLFHFLVVLAAFGLVSWWTGHQQWLLIVAGLAVAAATAVRYEGWFYAATFVPLVIAGAWYLRRDWRYPAAACLLAVSFMALWMQQHHALTGDPFSFVRATEEIRFVEDPENIEAGFADRVTFFPQRALDVAPVFLPAGLVALGLMLLRKPRRWAPFGVLLIVQAVVFIGMTAPFASLGPGAERFLLSNILLLSVPLGGIVSVAITRFSVGWLTGVVAVIALVVASFAPDWANPPLHYPAEDTHDMALHVGTELDDEPAGIAVVLLPSMPDERFNEGYAFRVLSGHPGRVEITDFPSRLHEAVQHGEAALWVIDDRVDADEPVALQRGELGGYVTGVSPSPASASGQQDIISSGEPLTVTGSEFRPDEPISSWWTSPDGDTYAGPDLRADPEGDLAESDVPLPGDALPGIWALTLAGQESLRQAFIEVEVVP